MTDRPAIDTADAIRALRAHDLDPEIAETLVRLVDTAVRTFAASQADLAAIRLEMEKSEKRVVSYTAVLFGLVAILWSFAANLENIVHYFSGI
ncbi:hypothetical protein [Ruegeria sp.]|uniref:hypothetical protein n=1 Tax=Ruegeria sp. TaxID=1879320 RepID=UPI003B000D9E